MAKKYLEPEYMNARQQAKEISQRSYSSAFAEWLKKNVHRKLPKDLHKLAAMSGLSSDTIKCFMYRRRKRVKDEFEGMPDLRKLKLILKDDQGEVRSTATIEKYEIAIDSYSLRAEIKAVMVTGEKLIFPIPDKDKFLSIVRSEAGQTKGS